MLHRSISRRNPPLSWLYPLNRTVKFQTFPNQPGGVTAVRLSRLPDETVKASSFAIQSRGATAVKLAAPSKLIRKVLKLPGSI
jgi:hypothetical protein